MTYTSKHDPIWKEIKKDPKYTKINLVRKYLPKRTFGDYFLHNSNWIKRLLIKIDDKLGVKQLRIEGKYYFRNMSQYHKSLRRKQMMFTGPDGIPRRQDLHSRADDLKED